MEFHKFKIAVAAKFESMKKSGQLFRTAAAKDGIWETYLSSFPEGSNPLYRERTEHDCNACKNFMRAVGNVVAVVDGALVSIWDVKGQDPAYQVVANALAAFVKASPIENLFVHTERVAGTDKNFEQIVSGVKTWEHFFINVPAEYVKSGAEIGPYLGDTRALRDVFFRSMTSISTEAVDAALDLIASKLLYRGEEFKFVATEFKKQQKLTASMTEEQKNIYCWVQVKKLDPSVLRIRNTAFGTLLQDLSEDVDLDAAVRKFGAVMAPGKYKHPESLATGAMIKKAKEKILELGYMASLVRRYANVHDIKIDHILHVGAEARTLVQGDVFDDLAAKAPSKKPKSLDTVQEISIEKFISDVLPTATSLEVFVENTHASNFASLITAEDPTAPSMFKWDNNFSWAYAGNTTDSIKERVKQAGGSVVGDLCCRLAWFNHDDLDFEMHEPGPVPYTLYFANRQRASQSGGWLDVDMNAGMGTTRTPVENIFYANKNTMKKGTYRLYVNLYSRREQENRGFEVEIDMLGQLFTFSHDGKQMAKEKVLVAEIEYDGKNFTMKSNLKSQKVSKEIWNIQTEKFHPVKVMMLSPNHWGDIGVGNKHYFFMMDGCKNDGTARGFFNEFLNNDLAGHGKAMEMVGCKMTTTKSDQQLSGLGFSSTNRNALLCKVGGTFSRVMKITF